MSSELFKLGGDMIRPEGETEADMIEAIRERVLDMMDENPDLFPFFICSTSRNSCFATKMMPLNGHLKCLSFFAAQPTIVIDRDFGPLTG